MAITRRHFVKLSLASLGTAMMQKPLLHAFDFLSEIDNPLQFYPSRDWERIYRNQFKHDSEYHFLCAPNDTHNCLLKAFVKNGVITRIGPSYGYGKAKDLDGNTSSHRWEPRLCNKGLALGRRVYGPRRVKYPMVREGFKRWVDDGFPRGADGKPPESYMQRGKENFVRVSWDEIYDIAARGFINISTTYSGKSGQDLLRRQGYDPATIETTKGAGTQVLKFRGGMPLLGITRVFGMYRLANSLALLDSSIRSVGPDTALGGRGFDNYTFHTDLPPGHPMVTGQQTIDFDLFTAENAKLIMPWGMNWISTKMPDSHWLTEARVKGAKVISVTVEYSSVASKSDEIVIIRPATDSAFALGLANIIMKEKLYDDQYVKSSTDLPLLVRMDTLKLLSAEDVVPDFEPPTERRETVVYKAGGPTAPPHKSGGNQFISDTLIEDWGNFVVWDSKTNSPSAVTRDDVGSYFSELGVDPVLDGHFEVEIDGQSVEVRTVFSLISQYLSDSFDPDTVSKVTWAPREAIESVARQIAENRGQTLIAVGMGPNQFFNGDLKDRALLLVCALTRNIGTHSGNIGSYAGNYRAAYYDGIGQYITENPFDVQLDSTKPVSVKSFLKYESAHYYNHDSAPLRVGNKLFTGKTHLPC